MGSLRETVFLDKEKLSPRYIPRVLPHREEEMAFLHDFFDDVLDSPESVHLRTVQIIGGVGSGKTSATVRFGRDLEEEAEKRGVDLKHLYVNLKLHGGSRVVLYRHMVESVAPEAYSSSLSAAGLLRQMVKALRQKGRHVLISLDEIDYFLRRAGEGVVYDLTRLNELYPGGTSGVLGVILTARDEAFHERLDKAELSTLGRNTIDFEKYTSDQIRDILQERVDPAFETGAVSREVLEYVSDVTASPPVDGDMRHALELLLYAGNLADNRGDEEVTAEHVRVVQGRTSHALTAEDVMNLPVGSKAVLLAAVRALRGSGAPYVSLREIEQMWGVVSEELGLGDVDDFYETVQDLEDRQILEIKSLTEIGLSGVSAEKLDRFLDDVLERVKKELT